MSLKAILVYATIIAILFGASWLIRKLGKKPVKLKQPTYAVHLPLGDYETVWVEDAPTEEHPLAKGGTLMRGGCTVEAWLIRWPDAPRFAVRLEGGDRYITSLCPEPLFKPRIAVAA